MENQENGNLTNDIEKKTRVRLYVGSIAAIGPGGNHQFAPFAIITISIDSAARDARTFAYKLWPVADAWRDHAAVIAPLPVEMYEAFGKAAVGDNLDIYGPGEDQTLFKFKQPNPPRRSETVH